MATREIIALNTTTPQLLAPQTGDTYAAPRTVTITPETNTSALVLTGGAVTASNPLINATQTFNNGAAAFTGLKVNITNTASASYKLFDFQVGGVSKFAMNENNDLVNMNNVIAGGYVSGTNAIWAKDDGARFLLGTSGDVVWHRIAAGITKLSDGSTGAGVIRLQAVTVANLPSAATAGNGARAHVTDASGPTFGATVSGGGSTSCPVYSDGTNWKVG